MIFLPGISVSLLIGIIPAFIGLKNKQLKLGLIGLISCLISGSVTSFLLPALIYLMVDGVSIEIINSLIFGIVGSVPFAELFVWQIKKNNKKV